VLPARTRSHAMTMEQAERSAEQEVREAWENVEFHSYIGAQPDLVGTALVEVYDGHDEWESFGWAPPDEVWNLAVAFTRERQREIAELDREMAVVELVAKWYAPLYQDVAESLLKRLSAIRADLSRGLRGTR
jgi:hypothetical protein